MCLYTFYLYGKDLVHYFSYLFWRLNCEGIMSTGRSSDPDTLVASAKAYLHAVNKLEARKAKRSQAA